MKRKLTAPQITNLIMAVIIIILFSLAFLFTQHQPLTRSYQIVNTLKPIDPVVPVTLPHHLYKQRMDSLRISRLQKEGMLAESLNLGPIGLQTNLRCENCDVVPFFNPEKRIEKTEYFIKLRWWKLDTGNVAFNPTRYYIKNDQSYLRKTICIETGPKTNPLFKCTEEDVKVPFRYNTADKTLMIPVSRTTMKISKFFAIGLGILFFIYFIHFVIGGFIKFLIEISQGTPFSENNVKRLRLITLSLFYFPISLFVINLLLVLIFSSYFSKDIVINIFALRILTWPAILYLIFVTLYTAFLKGKQLKEENDLTV